MEKQMIATPLAPAAIGPYSQAVLVDRTLYVSGQIPINPDTMLLEVGIEAQTKQVLANLKAILDEVSFNITDVVKTTLYLTDISMFSIVNELYSSFFNGHKPARSTVGVNQLPKGALLEIDLIAVK